MWAINPREILVLRGGGGEPFTAFTDDVIRAEAFVRGIPATAIRTTIRTNIADAGVDTQVSAGVPVAELGWLEGPTLWQYKAMAYADVSDEALRVEINKQFSYDLVTQGYAYRLCICDDMPAVKKVAWERILAEEVLRASLSAPLPKVVTASDLAAWASRFPPLAIKHFQRADVGVLHADAWAASIRSNTPTYVDVEQWSAESALLAEHVDLSHECLDAVLPIQGEAGVGKTRLAYEVIARVPNAPLLVLYTNDGKTAESVATSLANNRGLCGLLVADECTLEHRVRLNDVLAGHRDRVRVLALDNSGERPRTGMSELWLERIPEAAVERILAANFPEVPEDRRRAYVQLSSGFVRLAADLCRTDARIVASGMFIGAPPSIQNYYRLRLSEDEREVVEAISLLSRVGFTEDVSQEVGELCTLVGMQRDHVVRTALQLRDVPGFIALAGRYLYTTPEIIAMVAFGRAWERWVRPDPAAFLAKLPDTLLQPFLRRITRSGNEEASRIAGDYFRRWASTLEPVQLSSRLEVDRLVVLTQLQPDTYLPLLTRLICAASDAELHQTGEYIGHQRPTRRSLVWLAEELAVFPELFPCCETLLLRLAEVEVEPGISNNAGGVWRELFRVVLSGTAVPFSERLALLERHLQQGTAGRRHLAMGALNEAISPHNWRRVGSAVIGGRLAPDEWRPGSAEEYRACFDALLGLLQRLLAAHDQQLADGARQLLLKHLTHLLDLGCVDELQSIFVSKEVSDSTLPKLIEAIEDAKRYFQLNSDRLPTAKALLQRLDEWLESIVPGTLHGRVVATVGKNPWHHRFEDDEGDWQRMIASLASELVQQPGGLEAEIEWLSSADASSSALLGQEVGKADPLALHLDLVLSEAVRVGHAGFARGYVSGLLAEYPDHAVTLNHRLDAVQAVAPVVVYEISNAGGDQTLAVERTLTLVDSGQLTPEYLGGFLFGVGRRSLTASEVTQFLARLLDRVRAGDAKATRVAIELVAVRLDEGQVEGNAAVLADPAVQERVWELLEATAESDTGEDHWWSKILKAAASWDRIRAAHLAALAVLQGGIARRGAAIRLLGEIAKESPDVVMDRVGNLMLGDASRWHFFIGRFGALFLSLPEEHLRAWLLTTGVEGARAIARHLPRPRLDQMGRPVVPSLTEFVLTEFAGDDRTFSEFTAGMHSTEIMSGDIAAKFSERAEAARQFLGHSLLRIRQWAEEEIEFCRRQEHWWRQHTEEMDHS